MMTALVLCKEMHTIVKTEEAAAQMKSIIARLETKYKKRKARSDAKVEDLVSDVYQSFRMMFPHSS